MAIYHASISTVSRSAGHTATAAAAYRAGIALVDEQTGIKHDYTRRGGVAETLMMAPAHAPEWAKDPAKLWNAAEQAENRRNSTVAREFEVSLPHELTEDQRRVLVHDLAQTLVDRYGFAVQASTHAPHGGKGDDRNHHVHILATTRRMTPDGLGEKTRELDGGPKGRQEIQAVREVIAGRINHALTLAGQTARVDHRSLADQAEAAAMRGDLAQAVMLAREPTKHEGKTATAAKRVGHVLDRVKHNDQVRQGNQDALTDYLAKAEAEGRLHPPAPGQQVQATADAAKSRQAPTGPLVERAVEGYTATRNGKTVQIGGYVRQQRSAAPQASRKAGRGPVLPRGVSHAPSSPVPRSGAGLERLATVGGHKTKEQRAEEARQAEERRLAIRQMNHEEQMLAQWIAHLEASAQRINAQAVEGMRALIDDRQPLTPQAVNFRQWLNERAAIAGALDDAILETRERQRALDKTTAQVERRRQRLADHHAQPEEAKPEWWKSKRAWAERRRERETWQKQLERKVRHAIKREEAARAGLSNEALDEIEQQIDAASVALARHDASRARLFPDAELPRSAPTALEPPTTTPAEPRPDDPSEKQRQQQRARVNLTPRPELRPRR